MKKMPDIVKSGHIRSLNYRLLFCKIKNVFKTSDLSKIYFSFRDVVPEAHKSQGLRTPIRVTLNE